MLQNASHCDHAQLHALLDGRLNRSEVARIERHLDQCTNCREFLERQSAVAEVWNKAGEHLKDESIELLPLGNDRYVDGAPVESAVLRQVIDRLAPSDDPEMMGRIGTYEVIGAVGYGGMGVVLKGYDRALKRVVAIKVLAPHLAISDAARTRFAREAQAAAAVTHDNVIEIYGVHEATSLPYLVMPFSRGLSLQQRIDTQGPLEPVELLRIGFQIASGLAAFHEQGLVHRDIKPANILLNEQVDRLWITDFGLARAVDDGGVTKTGVIAGTPQFMSPEQARGESVDARSDLFSLGSVMYALCTGCPPFVAESTYGILRHVADTDPPPIHSLNPRIPDWLCRVIAKLHAKSPADRFQSAGEVSRLLQKCLAHLQHPQSVALPRDELPAGPVSKRRATRRIAGILLVAAFGFLMTAMRIERWRADESEHERFSETDPLTIGRVQIDAQEMATKRWSDLDGPGRDSLSRRHLKAIAMAIHAYSDAHDGLLPPPVVPNPSLPSERRLSGFVLLLPYFAQKPGNLDDPTWEDVRIDDETATLAIKLFDRIDLKNAWDDRVNDEAARTVLPVLANPHEERFLDEYGYAVSHFAFVRGYGGRENGAFPSESDVYVFHPDATYEQISDGSSVTLAVGQVSQGTGPWLAAGPSTSRFLTRPHDSDRPNFGSQSGDACYFAYCDGHLRFVDLAVSSATGLESLVTRSGRDTAWGNVRDYESFAQWRKMQERLAP